MERAPGEYDFSGYRELLEEVKAAGLKLQAVLSFHACGNNVGDTAEIPLPEWVLEAARGASRGGSVLETLYRSHAQLLTVFRFLDTNHDRKVSRDEFIAGFSLLVGEAGEAELSAELGDASDLFDAIDLDGSGQIELDEFCESFRISYDARRD